ncbi:conserved hypothetical protein [Mesorhizobium escarrei]|uniref:Zinc ribbon domain-containing protein n=1 Tax=Mesorhizobium escarrei TaxID=666018 RepID=A0ABM9E0Y4_9HYPH|nr:conserved hypothetical protein [Mesorhizobium escarrei]
MSYQYFSHEIDSETNYCVKCGRFLMELQETTQWVGNNVIPSCVEASNVSAISHIVRNQQADALQGSFMRPRSNQR